MYVLYKIYSTEKLYKLKKAVQKLLQSFLQNHLEKNWKMYHCRVPYVTEHVRNCSLLFMWLCACFAENRIEWPWSSKSFDFYIPYSIEINCSRAEFLSYLLAHFLLSPVQKLWIFKANILHIFTHSSIWFDLRMFSNTKKPSKVQFVQFSMDKSIIKC